MSRIDGEDQLGLSVFTSENGIVYFRVWTKGDNIKRGKNFFNKRCHYSIRKFAIGVASVMIGASIFGVNLVEAAETGSVGDKEGTITQAQPLEKLPDELAAVL